MLSNLTLISNMEFARFIQANRIKAKTVFGFQANKSPKQF